MTKTATPTKPSKKDLRAWLKKWQKGDLNKNQIERDFLGNTSANGQKITALWLSELGIDTRKVHPMVQENEELRGVIQALLEEADVKGFISWETRDAAASYLGSGEADTSDEA